MSNLSLIQTILVPHGAEYMAVRRGLSQVTGETPAVISIPVGVKPLTKFLQQYFPKDIQPRVLVMGLCGSLNQQYNIGDVVLYKDCVYHTQLQICDRSLTEKIYSQLSHHHPRLSLVKSLTSDRVICSAAEKCHLGETLGVDVVDMEGFATIEFLHGNGAAVAMLRVVSDNYHHDIPDITAAISPDGSLRVFNLALRFLHQPIAASHLIRGSLHGLKVLEHVTKLLFSTYSVTF